MKLKLNTEYARRHLFVTLLMIGLGLWFGYDGFIRYPATPADALYRSIEGSDAPEGLNLEVFKRQKTQTQYGFTVLSLLVGITVGLRLYREKRFSFEWDDDSIIVNGVRHDRSEIIVIDREAFERKSIVYLKLASGERITLDAWHHSGVRDFLATLPA